MTNDTTILLVGHGSRGRAGNTETINFAAQWRERHPEWRIEVCFIEHADVLLDEGLDRGRPQRQARRGDPLHPQRRRPRQNGTAARAGRSRSRHPGVEFVVTRHLGMGRESSPCCKANSTA